MQKLITLIFLSTLLFSCTNNDTSSTPVATVQKDTVVPKKVLPSPFESGKLLVLIDNNSFSFSRYKDTIIGFEYEVLSQFCIDNDLKLEFKVTLDPSSIINNLEAGDYHMAASNLNTTAERKKKINFTYPTTRANELLVQRLPKGWENMAPSKIDELLIRDRLNLKDEDIFVKNNSSHVDFLTNLKTENGLSFNIHESVPTDNIDDLVEKVASGQIDYSIISSNAAIFYQNLYADLDFKTPISLEHPIALAVNKSQKVLLEAFNNWLEVNRENGTLAALQNKYFGEHHRKKEKFKVNWEISNGRRISPYDEIVKQVAAKYDIDWVCLMALIYQESKFNPKAKSWVGARGLTQVMPRTAAEYGIRNPNSLYNPRTSIETGAKHFNYLFKLWNRDLKDSVQAVHFTLASYNAGRGHVLDGQRLAHHLEKDPDVWMENVEEMMLLKSKSRYYRDRRYVKYGFMMGKETVTYVDRINNYYKIFSEIVYNN